ncbi:uncharacterized protein LOC129598328 isoform X2 [Paramacrobiotus metropolitanus]|nr:uncharacterized protein LOC129598328 isoform X2 [Paramacrobiotus metropolitanus]XP_055352159.1 uncharacterized protein LOC129598328 isoform X2 [Paramacrobiotus metropolitanus]
MDARRIALLLLLSCDHIILNETCPSKPSTGRMNIVAQAEILLKELEKCGNVTVLRAFVSAVRNRTRHRIKLPQLTPVAADPHASVQRPFIGDTSSLPCVLGMSADTDYVWKHNDHLVDPKQSATSIGPLHYSHARSSDLVFLLLRNISYAATGRIECLQRCGDAWCLQKEYLLLPQPRAVGEVFRQPLPSLTVPRFTPVTFTCSLQFACSAEPQQHFTWMYAGTLMSEAMPQDHYLRSITGCQMNEERTLAANSSAINVQPAGTGSRYCQSDLTLTVHRGAQHAGGRVECWARADPTSQDWFSQDATLSFV